MLNYRCDEGYLYEYEIDISQLKILNLTKLDSLHWLAELISHRELNTDDREAYAFGRFLDGAMTDKCLIECIRYFDLGFQYVFKTKKACNYIEIKKKEIIRGELYDEAAHNKRSRIGKSQEIVTRLEKEYRRTGLFFDELLEEYK